MIGDRMKSLRKAKNLTQTKISAILQIPLTTYNSYERNVNDCPNSIIIKLAEFYNVTTDYLLNISDVQKIEKDNAMLVVTYKEKALLEEYRKCDDFGKAQSFGYVKALAKGTEQNFNDITKLENKEDNNNSNNKIS